MISKQHREPVLDVVLWLVLILACLGVVSSIFWYFSAQETANLKLANASHVERIQKLTDEVNDKRHKIDQANRLLSVAYPNAVMDFLAGGE